jgi:diguanylate cyclase (GGDEF)-like protein/PAS domain S-box-containing protein
MSDPYCVLTNYIEKYTIITMNKSIDKYKTIFKNLQDIYYETDMDGNITIISPSVKKYTDYDPEECINQNISFLFKGHNYSELFLEVLLLKGSVTNFEMKLTDKQGEFHHTLVSASIIKDDNEETYIISGLIKDICDQKKEAEELFQFATYDELTGLYNRRVGMEFLKQELKKIRRTNNYLSICYIDINDLKVVNDNFGHEAGDNLILAIIMDIKSAMRESDILSRIGGDEFLLIFPDCRLNKVKSIWQRVENSLELRNQKAENKYEISVSFGFAETSSDNILDIDELIQMADKRMYIHKRRAKIEKLNSSPLKL